MTHAKIKNDFLSLPSPTQALADFRTAGKRSLTFALAGAALTLLWCGDNSFMGMVRLVNNLYPQHPFGQAGNAINDYVRLVFVLILSFVSLFGSFALFLPKVRDHIGTYTDKFDTTIAVARQIALADGIGDTRRRAQASDILWTGHALREETVKTMVRTALAALGMACIPWLVLLVFGFSQSGGQPVIGAVAILMLTVKWVAIVKVVIYHRSQTTRLTG